ncbi:hypothetical protein ABW21_db0209111 [Orbilia brochopaga]|nr:hypothetical protein ABW21_db0209111 [Drechslerella brochopaga]
MSSMSSCRRDRHHCPPLPSAAGTPPLQQCILRGGGCFQKPALYPTRHTPRRLCECFPADAAPISRSPSSSMPHGPLQSCPRLTDRHPQRHREDPVGWGHA